MEYFNTFDFWIYLAKMSTAIGFGFAIGFSSFIGISFLLVRLLDLKIKDDK